MANPTYPGIFEEYRPPSVPLGTRIARVSRGILEAFLWLLAIAALGWFAYVKVEAFYFQQEQNERMNKMLRHRVEASQPAPALPRAPEAKIEGADETLPIAAAPVIPAVAIGDLVARIDIPRLKVSEAVIEGDDSKILRHAVGHIPGTALPGQPGNIGLAGHRDSFFRKIGELREGDELVLESPRGTFSYFVSKHQIVKPSDVSVLAPSDQRALTLVTCYPFNYIGSAPKRYVITATAQ